jgi:dephospho-CoA kinase
MREALRKVYGMEAYAKLNLPKINLALKNNPVVVDGLYSWEEYISLSNYYHENFRVVAVCSSPATRYARLSQRLVRPLTLKEAYSRDEAEILNLNKGGPIAMADFTIINESSLKDLEKETKKTISRMEKQS